MVGDELPLLGRDGGERLGHLGVERLEPGRVRGGVRLQLGRVERGYLLEQRLGDPVHDRRHLRRVGPEVRIGRAGRGLEDVDERAGLDDRHPLVGRGLQVLGESLLESQAVRHEQLRTGDACRLPRGDLEGVRIGVGRHEGHDLGLVTDEFTDDVAEDVRGHDDERAVVGARRTARQAGSEHEAGREDGGRAQEGGRAGDGRSHGQRPVSARNAGAVSKVKVRAIRAASP